MLGSKKSGFTLIEILIALFIFVLVSILCVSALHSILNTLSSMERHSAELMQLQKTLLIFSRDIEQTPGQSIITDRALEKLTGTSSSIRFIHGGFVNPLAEEHRSTLQLTQYQLQSNQLTRLSWPLVGKADLLPPSQQNLLNNVNNVTFEYLDQDNHFHKKWPLPEKNNEVLPKGVRIILELPLGKISQFYLIPGAMIGNQK